MKLNYIDNIELKGKTVFIRADFNVPLDEERNITDTARIDAVMPTIKYALDHGAKLILASHLGRPKGKVNPAFSLEVVGNYLASELNKEVVFFADYLTDGYQKAISTLNEDRIMLLENLRFHEGETKNDVEFAQKLAEFVDIYINDAFGTCHRAHASTAGIPELLPIERKGAGFLIKKEMEYFSNAISNPKRPYTAILGGAKVSDKINVILNLLNEVNNLIIGGAMAYTFLKYQGHETGNSLVEEDKLSLIKTILDKAAQHKVNILLPVDHIAAKEISATSEIKQVGTPDIPEGFMGVDIGPKTIQNYVQVVNDSQTTVWNGPMGVFEIEPFEEGTKALANALAKNPATTIIGGGDSAFAIRKFKCDGDVSHISTGGGASLEFLEGKELPGLKILRIY